MIYIKIKKDENIIKYIKVIREYDKTLMMSDIKKKIENHDFVLEHDEKSSYNVCDDINDIDRNVLFREILNQLIKLGAQIQIYRNDREISLEHLDNWLKTLKETEQEVQEDIDSELNE